MVAISGAIIPDPLAIPLIDTLLPSISKVADDPFENVSVVIMAFAAFAIDRSFRVFFKSSIQLVIL